MVLPVYVYGMPVLRKVAPEIPEDFEGLDQLIEDMFETITLFELRADSATWKHRDDGTYEVSLQLTTKKLRANGAGDETEIAEVARSAVRCSASPSLAVPATMKFRISPQTPASSRSTNRRSATSTRGAPCRRC